MPSSELVNHSEATSSPLAHYGRADSNPSTQNGLQEGPDEVPPPPVHAYIPNVDNLCCNVATHLMQGAC